MKGKSDVAQLDDSSPRPSELHRNGKNSGLMDRTREDPCTLPESQVSRGTGDSLATNPPPSGVGHQRGGPVKLKTRSLLPGSDGEHTLQSGTARLEEAVAADRAALEEYTRERVPLQWAAL